MAAGMLGIPTRMERLLCGILGQYPEHPPLADSGSPANWRFRREADDGFPDSRHSKGNKDTPLCAGWVM